MLNPVEKDLLQENWKDKTQSPINFKIAIGSKYEGQKKISCCVFFGLSYYSNILIF